MSGRERMQAIQDELDRLDPPSAAVQMRKSGAPGLWDGEGT